MVFLFFCDIIRTLLEIGINVANPIVKYNIIGDAEQIQLTNMQATAVELRAGGEELHWTSEHICQLDLRG